MALWQLSPACRPGRHRPVAVVYADWRAAATAQSDEGAGTRPAVSMQGAWPVPRHVRQVRRDAGGSVTRRSSWRVTWRGRGCRSVGRFVDRASLGDRGAIGRRSGRGGAGLSATLRRRPRAVARTSGEFDTAISKAWEPAAVPWMECCEACQAKRVRFFGRPGAVSAEASAGYALAGIYADTGSAINSLDKYSVSARICGCRRGYTGTSRSSGRDGGGVSLHYLARFPVRPARRRSATSWNEQHRAKLCFGSGQDGIKCVEACAQGDGLRVRPSRLASLL